MTDAIKESSERKFVGFLPYGGGVRLIYSRTIFVTIDKVCHHIDTLESEFVTESDIAESKYGDPNVLKNLFRLALGSSSFSNEEVLRIARLVTEYRQEACDG